MNCRVGIKTVSKNLNQIDRSLGGRLRDKRMSNGLSQEQLAAKLGIDPKDVDLYEIGAKRISADRLLGIAKALGVRPVYFFGFSEDITPGKSESSERSCEDQGVYLTLPDQGMRLHRAFINVKNSVLREAIVTLVVEMAKSESIH